MTTTITTRVVDAQSDYAARVTIEDGVIRAVGRGPLSVGGAAPHTPCREGAALPDPPLACMGGDESPPIHARGGSGRPWPPSGGGGGGAPAPQWATTRLALMPAFVDLHAHFRDGGGEPPAAETLESGCLAAVAGGYGTVVCMANTLPVVDGAGAAGALRRRALALGLVDLYPVVSLTAGMEGRALSGITAGDLGEAVRMLSEDGRDVGDDGLFLAAMREAARLGLPVSCHCDWGGEDAATRRALALAAEAGCRVHIAHVSTRGAVEAVREAKAARPGMVTCEATPHHLALTAARARELGEGTWGRVAPPLRGEADREAVVGGLVDGTIDAIATDHAPHTAADKAAGRPGFSGLETAFAVCYTALVASGLMSLSALSALMSARPAGILGFRDRGLVLPGYRADLVLVDLGAEWRVDADWFASRGKNTAFGGMVVKGRARVLTPLSPRPPRPLVRDQVLTSPSSPAGADG